MKEKDDLREKMKWERQKLIQSQKEIWDCSIYNNLINNENYINSKIIFIFVSFEKEVHTHKIIQNSLLLGKTVCVPKVVSKDGGMKAIAINSFDELVPGKYGILEPKNALVEIEPINIDLVLLPGLAFDQYGGRIGYGGGYYDRFLSKVNSKTVLIGLAYNFQLVPSVPMAEYDIRTNFVITERNINTINKSC